MSGFIFRQARNLRPIAAHHGFFLLAAPALYLHLGRQGLFPRDTLLRPSKLHRTARYGITLAFSGLVLADAPIKIVGVTGVIAIVGTAENVHPKHFIYPCVAIHPSFDKLRTNGLLNPHSP
jgi:hypothetical protein